MRTLIAWLLVGVFTVGASVSTYAHRFDEGIEPKFGGEWTTVEDYLYSFVEKRMQAVERFDEEGRRFAEEQVYLHTMYNWVPQHRLNAFKAARQMLIEARVPERLRLERINDRNGRLSERERQRLEDELRKLTRELFDNFRVDGSVHGRFDIAKKELAPLPSATMNEQERRAREAEIRQEILNVQRPGGGRHRGGNGDRGPAAADPEDRWVRDNLWVRIEFEDNREIVRVGLDNPSPDAVAILSRYFHTFTSDRSSELAFARGSIALDEVSKRNLIPEHRRALENAKKRERRIIENLGGHSPKPTDPGLDYFMVYPPNNIFKETVIAQARRELGAKFEEAAAEELALLAEHAAVFDPTLQQLAEEKAARVAEGAEHGHDVAPTTQPEG